MSTANSGRREGLHWAGLILGLFAATWPTLWMTFGYVVAEDALGMSPLPFVLFFIVIPAVVLLAGVALAWKKPLAGGITLIIASLVPIAVQLVYVVVTSPGTLDFSLGMRLQLLLIAPPLCLPLLVAGVLILLSRREERRAIAQGMKKVTTTDSSRGKGLYWAGLVFGLAFASLFTLRMVATPLFTLWMGATPTWEFLPIPVIVLTGLAIAWKWPFAGGVMLIVEGVALIATYMITFPLPSDVVFMARVVQMLYVTFFYGLPFIVTGVLFILSWREGTGRALASSATSEGDSRQD